MKNISVREKGLSVILAVILAVSVSYAWHQYKSIPRHLEAVNELIHPDHDNKNSDFLVSLAPSITAYR